MEIIAPEEIAKLVKGQSRNVMKGALREPAKEPWMGTDKVKELKMSDIHTHLDGVLTTPVLERMHGVWEISKYFAGKWALR